MSEPTFDVELIRRTVCVGATNDELSLFLHTCRRLGLDPLLRQIYAVKRYSKAAGREVMQVQVGIDGYRIVAERTGELDGIEIAWCGDDGAWRDVWLERGQQPAAAKATIWRIGRSRPFVAVARFVDYQQTTRDGRPSGLWGSQGPLMIGKVAEALGLRRAFPADLSGTYVTEEIREDQEPRRNEADDHGSRAIDVPQQPSLPSPAADDLLIAVRECESEEEVRRLAPELAKLTGADKDAARREYAAKLSDLRRGGRS